MNNKPFYKIGKDEVLSNDKLATIIERFLSYEHLHLKRLYNYYMGRTDILQRVMSDTQKPNNKIVNPYANNITNTFVGYFLGEPVSYKYKEENNSDTEVMKFMLNNNDEDEENSALGVDASIFGYGLELSYINESATVRFTNINPIWTIIITDDTVEENVRYIIRLSERETFTQYNTREYGLSVYTPALIEEGEYNNGSVRFINSYEHNMGQIPVSIFKNNDELLGDYEQVMSLIDAYDKLMSDSINDYEAFVDAYLVLENMDLTSEEAAKMRQNRVLILPEGGKASWLIKEQQDTYVENLKKRIDESIYKFANCPNMSDESFAGNASGVAIQYKLMGMENLCSKKERSFKAALYNRLSILNNVLRLFGGGIDVNAVEISFKRNIPANLTELAGVITMLSSVVSKETLLSLLPFVEDAKLEAERKQAESAASMQMIVPSETDIEE
jgi:SPP1 family phage portal protein